MSTSNSLCTRLDCEYLDSGLAAGTPISGETGNCGERKTVDPGPSVAAGEAMIRAEPRHNRRPAAIPRFGFRRSVTACLLFFLFTLRLPLPTVVQLSIPPLNSLSCYSPRPPACCNSSAPLSPTSPAFKPPSASPRHHVFRRISHL